MSGAYYNEFDPDAAAWLEELIRQGHIAPGQVDTRSIEDVRPDDLRGFTQCHFFAGIGAWSYALRRAGWSDDRPVWTGSCPCQPFSAAGKGAAFADERHLWPAFYHLIAQHVQWCRQQKLRIPEIVGEQVASKAVDEWIDLVHADLEALGYAFGSIPFPSAGVGAPHIRDRNFWVAHASGKGLFSSAQPRIHRSKESSRSRYVESERHGTVGRLGDASSQGLAQRERERGILGDAPRAVKGQAAVGAGVCDAGGLADANHAGRQLLKGSESTGILHEATGAQGGVYEFGADRASLGGGCCGPTNGFWRDADWLGCRDGKWRPVEPGTFPLADGAAARVVRLRGYGNAINAEAAQAWIETVMECIA